MSEVRVLLRKNPTEAEFTSAILPIDEPVEVLATALASQLGNPVSQAGDPLGYYFLHKTENGWFALKGQETLRSAGVGENDYLTLMTEPSAGGGFPIRTFKDIQLVEAVFNNSNILNNLDGRVLYAVFLYTDEDTALANYMRHHVRELDEMTSQRCMFFLIEEPSKEWQATMKLNLEALGQKYSDTVWQRLGVDTFKPYDKTKAYEIGRRFGLKPKQIPCIVFFSRLLGQEILVVELKKFIDNAHGTAAEFTLLFRALFSHVEESMEVEIEKSLKVLAESIRKEEKRWTSGSQDTTEKTIETIKLSSSLIDVIGKVAKLFIP